MNQSASVFRGHPAFPGESGDGVKVKICGINDDAAFDAARGAGADWIGFVFFPASPRFITPTRAAELSARASLPLRVGLFVDPAEADVAAVLETVRLDALQLYASPVRAAALRQRFQIPVWRGVGVGARSDLPGPEPRIDAFLVEAKAPPGATRPGGNAVSFDWGLTADWHAPLPWLLAGGLTPENVAEAIAASGARAVDVSSGVERAKGVKDPDRIAAFVAAAKGAGGYAARSGAGSAQ